ncbi:MAG: NAD(P)H-hydrate dehydratase [Kangiellaceae bacterium]|nr:NAD(P)H-hydrate dehydratase [Kangiellaceae bacterium]
MSNEQGLYTAAEIKQLEQLYAKFSDGSSYRLMERAGAAIYSELIHRWPQAKSVLVICGKGNNGGDGYVVARRTAIAGLNTTVALLPGAGFDKAEVKRDEASEAERAFARLKDTDAVITDWDASLLDDHEIVVDAMLGIGIVGEVRKEIAEVIRAVNTSNKTIIAVDVPSGLAADTGAVMGSCIHADVTMTFIGVKRGLLTGLAADYCGEIVLNDLKCGQGVLSLVRPKVRDYKLTQGDIYLTPRRKTSHKGFNGHLLLLGGSPGFSGAIRMAAEAAARTGAGLVSVLTHPQHADVISMSRPELMCHAIPESASKESLTWLFEQATTVAVGPGLGVHKWGRNLLAALEDFLADERINRKQPTVVWDADALNILSERPKIDHNRIITPHPAEAARLLESSVTEVQNDRFQAAQDLSERFGGTCLLKGAGTIVCNGNKTHVVNYGNPGMATGGMGDILTGIVAGLLAQGVPQYQATCLAAAIHGQAAELAVTAHTLTDSSNGYAAKPVRLERGLLATDLLPYIHQLVNPV